MKITIEKFQNLFSIINIEMNEVDRSILLLKVLTGKTEQEVENMSIKKFNKLSNKINDAFKLMNNKLENEKPVNIVKCNGHWYKLNYNLNKKPMNAGKYVETTNFNQDVIGNLHKIMATMATPLEWSWKGLRVSKKEREHSEIAEDMLQMEFSKAYHSMVFFWAVFTESIKSMTISIMEDQKNPELNTQLQNFIKISDGLITAKWFQNLKTSV